MRGSFLFLDQTKENKFIGGEKEKREKKGESQSCTLRFLMFQWSEVNRPKIKVGLLEESYE